MAVKKSSTSASTSKITKVSQRKSSTQTSSSKITPTSQRKSSTQTSSSKITPMSQRKSSTTSGVVQRSSSTSPYTGNYSSGSSASYNKSSGGYSSGYSSKGSSYKSNYGSSGSGDAESLRALYAAQLQAQAEEEAARQLAAQQAAAQQQGQLAAQQAAIMAARQSAYENTVRQQQSNYEYSAGQMNAQSDSSLQQAYLNKMLSLKGLNQNLTAMGLSGGASESTLAGMYNNYGNARGDIEASRISGLGSLQNTLQNNLSTALNDRATGSIADLKDYTSALNDMYAKNVAAGINLTGASLDTATATNLAKMLKSSGVDNAGVSSYLAGSGIKAGDIAGILNQLG